jgi:hypothetical protein
VKVTCGHPPTWRVLDPTTKEVYTCCTLCGEMLLARNDVRPGLSRVTLVAL